MALQKKEIKQVTKNTKGNLVHKDICHNGFISLFLKKMIVLKKSEITFYHFIYEVSGLREVRDETGVG